MKNNKNKLISIAAALLIMSVPLAGCSGQPQAEDTPAQTTITPSVENNKLIDNTNITLYQFESPQSGSEIATIKTSMGAIRVMFFPSEAPKAVENFITHAKAGYYNGLDFYKVLENFMIVSGDPTSAGTGGESIYKDESGNKTTFEDELTTNLWHFRGALAMDNNGANSNTSRFFIVTAPAVDGETLAQMNNANFPQKVLDKYKEIGGMPYMDGKHTVFGHIMQGMDIVDEISKTPITENDAPVEKIIIESIEFELV